MSSAIAVSKIFQYGKTTIPKEVRIRLRVGDGDSVVWSINELGHVTVSKRKAVKVDGYRINY